MNPMTWIAAGQAAFELFQKIRTAVAAGQVTKPDGSTMTVEEYDALCGAAKAEILAAGDDAQARKDARHGDRE